jgi:hypothetical protein
MLVYTTNPLAIERLFKVSNNFENCRVQWSPSLFKKTDKFLSYVSAWFVSK